MNCTHLRPDLRFMDQQITSAWMLWILPVHGEEDPWQRMVERLRWWIGCCIHVALKARRRMYYSQRSTSHQHTSIMFFTEGHDYCVNQKADPALMLMDKKHHFHDKGKTYHCEKEINKNFSKSMCRIISSIQNALYVSNQHFTCHITNHPIVFFPFFSYIKHQL